MICALRRAKSSPTGTSARLDFARHGTQATCRASTVGIRGAPRRSAPQDRKNLGKGDHAISTEWRSPMNPSKVKNTSGTKATWKAPRRAEHGRLDAAEIDQLPRSAFAFPRSRNEPM